MVVHLGVSIARRNVYKYGTQNAATSLRVAHKKEIFFTAYYPYFDNLV